jgi:glycosyltransferase involved in cell wall biosynthesis
VLVNDSSDGGKTLKIAELIAELDNRVKVYDFKKKSGGIVGESKYRAAVLCNGEYLMELDHDDYILPEAGKMMVEAFMQYPDAKFVYSDCAEIWENHESITYGEGFAFGYGSYRNEVWNGRVYKAMNTVNINPKTIRHIVGVPNHFRAWDRKFYHSIGGHNRRLTIADDYELIVRTFLNTKMVRIPKMLYLQFYHSNNTQDKTRADIQRRVKSIREHYNQRIYKRFNDLGVTDWAYEGNNFEPILVESRFGEEENYVNYIFQKNLEMNNPDYSKQFNYII